MPSITGRTLFRPDSIPTNLELYLKFDEASGNRADSSGNGNTATVSGTVPVISSDYWNTGENSVDFQGDNTEYFTVTRNAGLDLTGKFTIAFWLNADATTNDWLLDKDSANDGYGVFLGGSGLISLEMTNTENTTASAVTAGKWEHWCAVYDQTNVIWYKNGNVDKITAETTDNADAATNLTIGKDAAGSFPFDGQVKDLAIWSDALTPVQAKSLALGQDQDKIPFRPTDLETQPTVLWKFNEAVLSGTRSDSIGSVNLTDPATTPAGGGYIDGAAVDLSSDYLSVAANTAFDFSGGVFSVSAWVYITNVVSVNYIFAQKKDNNNLMRFQVNAGGKLRFLANIAGSVDLDVNGATVLKTNTWHHIALTEDGDTYKLYLDGKDDTDTGGTDTDRTANDYTGTFYVGAQEDGVQTFAGRMADLAIWKGTALTATEVRKLTTGLDINDQGMVSYHKMDDASGNATDSSGNSKTFTENGTISSVSGQVGNARDIESAGSESFSLSDDNDYDPSYLTVATWASFDSNSAHDIILSKGTSANSRYTFQQQTDASLRLLCGNGSSEATATSGASAITSATFHGCVGRFDGANINVWVDSKKGANASLSGTFPGNAEDIFIGRIDGGETSDEILDDLLFFNRAMHDEEIKALYLKGYNGLEATHSDYAGITGQFFMVI